MIIIDFSIVIFFVAFLISLFITWIVCKKKKTLYKISFFALVELYIFALVKVTIMPIFILKKSYQSTFFENVGSDLGNKVQLIPFKTIYNNFIILSTAGIIQNIGNILLLVPLAFIVAWLTKEKNNKVFVIAIGLIASLGIETIQFVINAITKYPSHAVDVDDLILNYLGYIVAVGMIWFIKKKHELLYAKVKNRFVLN